MNPILKRKLFAIATTILTLGGEIASGQTAPATSANPSEEAVKLDPFNVSADSDVGFVAASSLAGGRISTALKDTPVAYSVVTSEFLEAFNVTDIAEASQWTVNSNLNEGDGSSRVLGLNPSPSGNVRSRGVVTGSPTRNFFPYRSTGDSYNLDRVDFARGPNAVLFGAGGVGGTVNSVTKQANPERKIQEARVQVGSFNRYRLTADVNQPVSDKAALRANLMWEESDTWRDREWNEKYGLSVAGIYKLTPNLTVRGEFEYSDRKAATVTTSLRDRLSAWDGVTTFAGIPNTLPTNAQLAAAGIVRSGMRWVLHPDFGDTTALNFEGRYVTKGAQQNNNVTLTNRLGGVPIRTVGFSLNNQAMIDDVAGVPANRYASALAGSPFFKVPSREFTPLWSNRIPTFREQGRFMALYLNYKLAESLFIEVAGNMSNAYNLGNTATRRGLMDVYIDIDRTLPNGVSNPNFLHPFVEHMEYRNFRWSEDETLRVQAVYVKETRIGKLQFSAMAGANRNFLKATAGTLLLPLTGVAPDARSWVDNLEYSEFGVFRRSYLDQPARPWSDNARPLTLFDPIRGVTEIVTPKWMYDTRRENNNFNSLKKYQFLQAAGNLDLFKNRLVLIGAVRRDFTHLESNRYLIPGDNAPGWDGTTLVPRKPATADYNELVYFPKNAAGVVIGAATPAEARPRATVNRANIPQPQYAGDVFKDDFDSPILRPRVDTFTAGAVVNVTRWLGVYGNVSDTFSLNDPQLKLDGSLNPPTNSRGSDYGVRITLPNGKLAVSLGRYESYQAGAALRPTGNVVSDYQAIYNAPVVGDLSPVGRNNRGVKQLPQGIFSTVTNQTEGYEFETTANLTPAWRLVLNAGYTDANVTDQFPDIVEYIADREAISRQILADAGVVIDANNDASINPTLDDPSKINQAKVLSAVNGWNDIYDNFLPNLLTAKPQQLIGSSKWVGNIATDYRFRSGRLQGLRVGGGINYRGGQVVGYRGNDTIIDPSNPNVAIDDPEVDGSTPVLAQSYYKAVASLSYTLRLGESGRRVIPKTVQFDFNIDNLFNRRAPIFGNIGDTVGTGTTQNRPRIGEDISSPARRTVPGNFSYLTPRNYTLSAKLNF
jgi:outer membrane receptor protein involved in Fe transport